MKERGIIFGSESVKAILDGSKTVTRRVLRDADSRLEFGCSDDSEGHGVVNHLPEALHGSKCESPCDYACGAIFFDDHGNATEDDSRPTMRTPFGGIGSRLYVKESWRTREREDGTDGVVFKADNTFHPIDDNRASADAWVAAHANGKHGDAWRPSMYMPRWASRIELEVTSVRVERLQSITQADVIAEGVKIPVAPSDTPGKVWPMICVSGKFPSCEYMPERASRDEPYAESDYYVAAYASLWDTINHKRAPWASNPWIWACSFRRVTP